jgi:hypothetical protein
MQILKLRVVLGALLALSTSLLAETLTFIPQRDLGGVLNNSWSGVDNWFIENVEEPQGQLIRAGRLPREDDTAVIQGTVDAGGVPVRMKLVIVTNHVSVLNGYFALENVQLLGGNTLSNSTISLLGAMAIRGENCVFRHVTLKILSTGTLHFDPVVPGFATSLDLSEETLIDNGGQILLTDNALLTGSGSGENRIVIHGGTTLAASGIAAIRASTEDSLIIDNSGTVRVENGNLGFENEIAWKCGEGMGRFHAADASSTIEFERAFRVDSTATSLFTGVGISRLKAGASIDGTVLVGDGGQPGNLELRDSLEGGGVLRVLGGGTPGGILDWLNGTISLRNVEVTGGGTLNLAGGEATIHRLDRCTLRNSGSCVIAGPGLEFGEGARVINDAAGVFETSSNAALTCSQTNQAGFDNAGTFRHLGPGVLRFGNTTDAGGPDFNNTGVVDVRAGELRLQGGVSDGEFSTAEGGTLWFWGGRHTLEAGARFVGEGAVKLLGVASAPIWLVTGPIEVSTLDLGPNGTLRGQVNSTNQIRIGILTVNGGVINDGRFTIGLLDFLNGTTFNRSVVTLLEGMSVTGPGCGLDGTAFYISPRAVASIVPATPETRARLSLLNGALVRCDGHLVLAEGSRFDAAGGGFSTLDIQNGGLLKAAGSCAIGGSAEARLVIDNNGRIQATAGNLQFENAIDWACSSGLGAFESATPNATMTFSAPFYVEATTAAVFLGPGTARWMAGARAEGGIRLGAPDPNLKTFVPGTVELAGTLAGAGSLTVGGTPTNGSTLLWNQGGISLPRVDIAAGGRLLAGGLPTDARLFSRSVLWNAGLVAIQGAGFALENNSVIHNLATGVFELQSDGALTGLAAPAGGTIHNAGAFLKASAGAFRIGSAGDQPGLAFNNTGSLSVKSGRLAFTGAWLQTAGNTQVDSGAVLECGVLDLQGGILGGPGTLDARVQNAGAVTPGASPGVLATAVGRDYTQTAAGALVIDLGGANPGVLHDQLSVGGKASLNGKLEVRLVNNFAPKPGDTFTILTAASITGSFPIVASPDPTALWVPRYSSTGVTITLANPTGLTAPKFNAGSWTLPFQTTPGFTFVVQKAVSLDSPEWQTLATVEGDGALHTVADPNSGPQAFYRILMR